MAKENTTTAPAKGSGIPAGAPERMPRFMPNAPAMPVARFGTGGEVRIAFVATAPDEVAFETLLESSYWRHVARNMHIGATIEVRNDALTFWALLIVTAHSAQADYVEVALLFKKDLTGAVSGARISEGYRYEYRGITDKWIVIRDVDGHVMRRGLDTANAAYACIQTEMLPMRAMATV